MKGKHVEMAADMPDDLSTNGKSVGNKGSYGPMSGAGQRQKTSGASVKSGLSDQASFAGDSLASLGQANASGRMNQVPKSPKNKVKTDRGGFTIWG